MNSSRRIIFHLGPHKTATTHIQRTFLQNGGKIRAAGVRTYGPEFLRKDNRSISNLFGIKRKRIIGLKRPVQTVLDELFEDAYRIVLSDENFLGQLHNGKNRVKLPVYFGAPRRLGRLSQRLAGNDAELFMSMRSPWSFLTSAYSQLLLAGGHASPQEFAALNDPANLDWSELFLLISILTAFKRIVVWRYEDYPVLQSRLMSEMLGPVLAADMTPHPERAHQSMSGQAVRSFLEGRNEQVERMTAAEARLKFPVSDEFPKLELYSSEQRAASDAAYARQVARIRTLPGVTFLDPADVT